MGPDTPHGLTLSVCACLLCVSQVSTWFANARRRLKQVVSGELLPWQERVRLYNSCVKGNAELLSLSSDDSVWNDDGGKGESGEGVDVTL